MKARQLRAGVSPAVTRLGNLTPLDAHAFALLDEATQAPHEVRANKEFIREREAAREPLLILDGWAAHVRHFPDGRRQILGFVLPGELIAFFDHERPRASSTIMAVSTCSYCKAPARGRSPALDRAYAISRAHNEVHLLSQIARLGRMDAHDRLIDLLLELFERLELAGLARHGEFSIPATQELLADALGITTVHINRTLQQARRAGELEWTGKTVQLRDCERLRSSVAHHQVDIQVIE